MLRRHARGMLDYLAGLGQMDTELEAQVATTVWQSPPHVIGHLEAVSSVGYFAPAAKLLRAQILTAQTSWEAICSAFHLVNAVNRNNVHLPHPEIDGELVNHIAQAMGKLSAELNPPDDWTELLGNAKEKTRAWCCVFVQLLLPSDSGLASALLSSLPTAANCRKIRSRAN